ncbi:conjugal transfer relaxosome DNA-binding protein TraM [Aeromonas salmonicida]|uniref:conjugal transfer relaxosome DNA-binding protein TraM n=1 Tax=Aeromonas salmonicida TaxID=645 RepID=UPI000B3F6F37|nr:conjugal transfer relaxosome DNA-binding protein TraM [Aeromonas salmonicida]ARW85440.1 conjugal transfer protein TraM [Aeromonas salmonicida]
MPKVTVYLKNTVIDEIKGLVEEDIQAGAHPEEVSFSSKTSMLLELGLRVYNLRRSEHAGNGRDEFDRLLLHSSLESMFLSQHLAAKLVNMEKIEKDALRMSIDRKVAEKMEPFFPATDDE